ncbi:MAG: hypothetical protein M3P98_01580 [bacterium]|nr:hypothetical protein [bacterium]
MQLKINTVDRSSQIDWKSLAKTEGLTKEADSLSFVIKKTPSKTIPALGQDVELFEDAIKIFAGTITEKNDYNIGGILLGYTFTCKDKVHQLDRKLVVKAYENQTAQAILENIIDTFTTGITYTNIQAGTPTLGSVKFNYEQPSKCIQKIADLIGYDWYIDVDGDLHFFNDTVSTAPFEINDTDYKLEFGTLNFNGNILELKNSIVVRGGEYQSEILEAEVVDKYIADGTQRVFVNIYRYANIFVKVDGVLQTVGIDNITDETTVDCLYNFTEKAVKFRDNNKPANGIVVKIYGDAYIPLIVKVRDQISVAAYGEQQYIEVDKTITSVSEGKTFAKALLRKWASGSSAGSFKTRETGLRTGMQLTINSTIMGVNSTYKINRIQGRANGSGSMIYSVSFISSGNITFTDIIIKLLGRDKLNIEISDDEVLQRLEIFPEVITVADMVTVSAKTGPYTWATSGSSDLIWNFGTWVA